MLFLAVHHEDDLLAILDRILQAPEHEVLLAIPDGARILASEENFGLLKREAEAAGKRVVIQSSDLRARRFATHAGLPLFQETGDGRSRRTFSDILPPRGFTPQTHPHQEGAVPADLSAEAPRSGAKAEALLTRRSLGEAGVREGLGASPQNLPRKKLSRDGEEEVRSFPEPGATDEVPVVAVEESGTIPLLEDLPERVRRRSLPVFRLSQSSWVLRWSFGDRGRYWFALASVAVGLTIVFLVANEVLPRVEVRVQPRTEAIELTVPLTVRVDGVKGGEIAGQKVRVEETEEKRVPASGTAEVTQLAKGSVTIFNAFSSAPQTLVATTRLVSQDGKLFRLDQTTVVPGAKIEDGTIVPSSVDASVSADESGPEYNIGPSSFSIPGFQGTPKFTAFTARSKNPMTGGARGTVKIATAEDVERAQEGLGEALGQKLRAKFAAQIPEGFTALEEAAVETVTVTTNVEVEGQADEIIGRAEGARSAILFRDDALQSSVSALLDARIPDETEIVTERLVVAPEVKQRDIEKGIVVLNVAVEAQAAWRIDVEALRSSITGKREGEIRGWLAEQEAIESATVRFSPFWVSSAPENPKRITVRILLNGEERSRKDLLDRTVAAIVRWTQEAFSSRS